MKKPNTKPLALIVDDDQICREIIKETLDHDYDIITAFDGLEGLRLYEKYKPQIIVTDLNMPRMDGLKFIRNIRKKDMGVYIIIITGYGSLESAIEAIRLGVDDYVQKPFKIDELLYHVNLCYYNNKRKRKKRLINECISHSSRIGVPGIQDKNMAYDNQAVLYPFVIGGLLHNSFNTLMSLRGILDLSLQSKPSLPINEQQMKRIHTGLSHLGMFMRLMQQISQGFYRSSPLQEHTDEIRKVVEQFAAQEARATVGFLLDPAAGQAPIPAGVITFIVEELLRNASKACSTIVGATINVSISVNSARPELSIECHDSGAGFPEGILSAICMQQLRAPAQGWSGGYGLFLIQELVMRLKGQLLASNARPKGAKIQVLLPYNLSKD